jgi:hypothetical protein
MLNYSTSEENYIKAIFLFQHADGTVTTNELAGELRTKPASVTDMMKKLKVKKLVHYQAYHGFRLSPDGKKLACGTGKMDDGLTRNPLRKRVRDEQRIFVLSDDERDLIEDDIVSGALLFAPAGWYEHGPVAAEKPVAR